MTDTFYGVKLTDMTGKVYYTEIEIKHSLTHNVNIISHIPIGSKYPHHTTIESASYWSGSITGAFENNTDTACESEYKFGDAAFRIEFIEWLHNGLVKTMQLSENFIIPVAIMGTINLSPEKSVDDPTAEVAFNWEQCGDRIHDNESLNCSKCGQMLSVSAKYCPNCGTRR